MGRPSLRRDSEVGNDRCRASAETQHRGTARHHAVRQARLAHAAPAITTYPINSAEARQHNATSHNRDWVGIVSGLPRYIGHRGEVLTAFSIFESFRVLKHIVSGARVREMSADDQGSAPTCSRPKVLPIGPSIPLSHLLIWVDPAERPCVHRSLEFRPLSAKAAKINLKQSVHLKRRKLWQTI